MAIQAHPFLEMHPDLAKKKSIRDNDMVKIINETGYLTLPAKITKTVPTIRSSCMRAGGKMLIIQKTLM